MKVLMNPLVLGGIAVALFIAAFGIGMWQVGYFDPATYASPKKEKEKKVKKAKSTAEKHEALEVEWMQKLSVDMDRWGKDLDEQKKKLDEREVALQEREKKLEQEKASIEQIEKHIEKMKADFENQLTLVETTQEGNVKNLAKLYTSMELVNAAKMISGMSDVQAFQVLRNMKDAKSAKILELWLAQPDTAEKAKRVSELIRLNQPNAEGSASNP